MSRNRLLMILFVLLCGAIAYAWMETPRQRRVTTPASSRNVTTGQVAAQYDVAPEIDDLDFSGGTEHQYQKPKKNLFAALYQPPKVVKRKKLKPTKKRKVVKVVPKVTQPVVHVPKQSGPPPMQPLNFLGHLKQEGVMTVFLAAADGEIFLVKKGDNFADGLVVDDLSAHEIVIRNKNTGQQVKQEIRTAKAQRLPRTNFKSGRPSSVVPKPQSKPEQEK